MPVASVSSFQGHIDEPAGETCINPARFFLRGWLWLAKAHPDFARVEAWADGQCIGHNETLFPRPDVAALLGLPAECGTGFQLFAAHLPAKAKPDFEVQLHARLHDGTLTEPLTTRVIRVASFDANRPTPVGQMEASHETRVAKWLAPLERAGGLGVEIGAFKNPVPGIKPFYVDCYKEFGFDAVHADYYGHACLLPFHDNSLDYVVTSHVLEHVANPVAALLEWYRVLRPGGLIYLIVPDRRYTWDHPRKLTTVEHMLDDFERGTTPCDPTHIDEFVYQIDWSKFLPHIPPADVPAKQEESARGLREMIARGEQINVHFHTFEPSNLRQLFETLRTWPRTHCHWELVDFTDRFPASNPNGVYAVVRVTKTWRDGFEGWRRHRRAQRDRRSVLRPDAEPFADFVQRCSGLGGVR